LYESTTKYKASADKKRRDIEFEEGDFMWAIMTKDKFPIGEYKKLVACKLGLVEIVEKINLNVYRLKLPSHIKTSDVFNVKHLVSFIGDSSDEYVNSRANSHQLWEDDVDQIESEFMRMNGNDASVKTPQRIVTRSQTRKTEEDRSNGLSARLNPLLAKKDPEHSIRRPFTPHPDGRVILLHFTVLLVLVLPVTYPVRTRSRVLA
jgi:hypothetical protein